MDFKALYSISYGLYVISSVKDNKYNGQIANTVNQVTADPAQVAIALNKDNLTHQYVQDSGVFSASILAQHAPMSLIGLFGFKTGRDVNKFEEIEYKIGKTGAPIVLQDSIAFMEANVVQSMDVGTHTIFVGELADAAVIQDHEPMTYAYYHRIKGGKSPKNAPTYQADEPVSKATGGETYKCDICGYVYDPKKGDPANNIPPGTAFADLPDDWKCPICAAGKDQFSSSAAETYKCDICGYIYDPKKGDPGNNIPAGTAFSDLPDDWKCPICSADKSKFSKQV